MVDLGRGVRLKSRYVLVLSKIYTKQSCVNMLQVFYLSLIV